MLEKILGHEGILCTGHVGIAVTPRNRRWESREVVG